MTLPQRFILAVLCIFAPAAQTQSSDFQITTGLVHHQVLQRDEHNVASVDVRGVAPASWTGAIVTSAVSQGIPLKSHESQVTGKAGGGTWQCHIDGLPAGGPYDLVFSLKDAHGTNLASVRVLDVLVGDLWLLAGQSNMEGMGELVDVEQPSGMVHSFDMAGHWLIATEPLHWLLESPYPAYWKKNPDLKTPAERLAKARELRANRKQGAGFGLPFAKEVSRGTNIPIGLIPCALGGTQISEWNPTWKSRGGNSLYGALILRAMAAGGKLKGILWYQGEADARDPEAAYLYAGRMRELITNLRSDLQSPDLPFYFVQLGRMLNWRYYGVNGRQPPPTGNQQWSALREAERLTVQQISHTGTVPAADLSLQDAIHVSTPDLKRLGKRMANAVLYGVYGDARRPPGPALKEIILDRAAERIYIRYTGVSGGFRQPGRVFGFSLWASDGSEIEAIQDARVDPSSHDTIVLAYDGDLPPGVRVAYGYGVNPQIDLVDESDMAAPCFGPVEIREQSR